MYISKYPILSQKDPTLFFPIVRLILAFETAHGAGHQLEALFLIDNSALAMPFSIFRTCAACLADERETRWQAGAYAQLVVLERRAENHSDLLLWKEKANKPF
ncbi:hypothetical protein M405DRAFT_451040 [Rhizopogon salebrosus TDB-379]|nr:hypothetical protein M405DRAFT_451040 [Rhizopogon salebrosus TDB-379]